MSEITKLYKNAGVKQDRMCEWTCKDSDLCSPSCEHYRSTQLYYPPFTAEKQIAILITLANYNQYEDTKKLLIDSLDGEIYIGFYQDITLTANATDKDFAECVAKLINNLWKDLTEEEKQQVKGILE